MSFIDQFPDVQPKKPHWPQDEDDLRSRKRQLIRWPGRWSIKHEPTAAQMTRFINLERHYAMNQPPVGQPATHNGKRMLWFFGPDIYVDGYVFAQCYGLPSTADQTTITSAVEKLFGKVRVVFQEDLPVQHGFSSDKKI